MAWLEAASSEDALATASGCMRQGDWKEAELYLLVAQVRALQELREEMAAK